MYKAKDLKLGREVAIKVLRHEMASDSSRLRRFEQEARAASALNHPNIVTIYEIGEHEGTPYIAMEYVKGKTLREILEDGPLPNDKLIRYATQMAEGLAKAHQAGIVHRDLKPENLMVTEDGLAKILDFGLAKLMPQFGDDGDSEMDTMTRATQQGAILGTLQYMSPEQAASRPVDYRSDQFSFGSILYEMATGRLAFKKDSMPQTLAAIIEAEPEPIGKLHDEIPAELITIVKRCLVKDSKKRYESTADLSRELKNVPDTSPTWRARRRALWAVAGLLAASLAFALGPDLVRLSESVWSTTTRAPVESIVVLPLRNLSGDPEQEYLADGMTEAMIADLAKIGALKVISRTSAMRYKDSDKALGDIASELNVDSILEGSVLRVGDRVRITAQLIDIQTETALWGETYERNFRDLLVLQSEVARAVAEEIEVAVTPEERRRLASARSVNPEAHEAYLTGLAHYYKLTPQDTETAISYFELALEKDPEYALAYVGIARVWGGRNQMGYVPPSEAVPLWEKAALKALELDDSLAEAHSAFASLKTWGEWDWPMAEEAFERAIELNPNDAYARTAYSHFLNIVGRPDEAMAKIERALELDPLNPFSHAFYGVNLNFVRRYDDAIPEFRIALRLTPGLWFAHEGLSQALHFKGSVEEAIAEWKSYLSARGDVEGEAALTEGYAEGGYAEALRRLAKTMEAHSLETNTDAIPIAYMYLRARENERALEWLERGFANHDPNMPYLLMPIFDSIRDDPRFQDLLRRMNFPE